MKIYSWIAFIISITIILFFLMDWRFGIIYIAGVVSGMYYMDEIVKYKLAKRGKHDDN